MYSIDRRSRTSADIRTVEADPFFRFELPARADEHGRLAVPAAIELGVDPFTFVTSAGAHTIAVVGSQLTVTAGDTGAACVRLDDDDLAAIVNDLKTPVTLLTAGTLTMLRGDLGDLLDWWVVLRSLLDERPAHTRGSVSLAERDGTPLDLHRAFPPGAADEDLAAFLHEAGFLHLQGWLDPEDMDQIGRDMDAALLTHAPDDGRSWWARTAAGEHRCVRMQHFDQSSPATARILDGDLLERIAALTGDGHRGKPFGTARVEALEKPIGVVEGISDVPWHKDCSLGMHSYNCCGLTLGISVTGADAESGQLRVVAGSHRALVRPAFQRRDLDLPVVDLPTAPGDITVHCSCTLHMAQPPVTSERRVLYTSFALPPREVDDGIAGGLQEIGRVREGAYKTVSQAAGHV